jgi:succinyl-CoA synthetase alpha subunit
MISLSSTNSYELVSTLNPTGFGVGENVGGALAVNREQGSK